MQRTVDLGPYRQRLRAAAEAGGASGAADAVAIARDFLGEFGFTLHELRPFLEILAAFEDHQAGKLNPLFAKVPRKGNRAHVADAMFKAAVAVTMQLYLDDGKKKPEAAAIVADALAASGIKIAATTVKNWHHRHSNMLPDLGLDDYRFWLDRFRGQEDAAARALAILPELHRREL